MQKYHIYVDEMFGYNSRFISQCHLIHGNGKAGNRVKNPNETRKCTDMEEEAMDNLEILKKCV